MKNCVEPKCKTKMSDGSPKLCPKHQEAAQVRAVNGAFESLTRELKRFRATCSTNQSPIRSVSYRVLDNGETKCHVTYSMQMKLVAAAQAWRFRRLDALLRGGQMCSNCCYNMSQNGSTPSTMVHAMRESYKAWDAASADLRKVMPPNSYSAAPGPRCPNCRRPQPA